MVKYCKYLIFDINNYTTCNLTPSAKISEIISIIIGITKTRFTFELKNCNCL